MLSNNLVRNTIAASAALAAIALIAPGAASAQPSAGSAEGVIDSGSAILDNGSSILNGGSIIDGARGILDSGSSIYNTLPGSGSTAPRQFCNQDTIAGGPGVTQTNHDLGRTGPNSFVLRYETYDIPDVIDVFYQGGLIFSTGYVGDDMNEGTGSAVINVPPGSETSVLVKVTGPGGTDWNYTVGCPIA